MAEIGGLSLGEYKQALALQNCKIADLVAVEDQLRIDTFLNEFYKIISLRQSQIDNNVIIMKSEQSEIISANLTTMPDELVLPEEVASISVNDFSAQMAALCEKAKEAIKNHATNARKSIDTKLSSPVQHSEAFTKSINNIESNASKVLGSIDKVLKEEHLTDAHKKECLELPGLIAGEACNQMTHEVTRFLNPPLNQNQNGNVTAKEEDVFQKIVELYDELLELDENQSLTPEKIMSSIKQMRDILQDSKNNSHTMAGSPYTIQAPKSSASASASRPQTPNHQNALAGG